MQALELAQYLRSGVQILQRFARPSDEHQLPAASTGTAAAVDQEAHQHLAPQAPPPTHPLQQDGTEAHAPPVARPLTQGKGGMSPAVWLPLFPC